MNHIERIYKVHNILSNARAPVHRKKIESELECSRSTIVRILDELRDYLGAPLEYDKEQNGYFYRQTDDRPYELPGFWLNVSELCALLACQELLSSVQPAILQPAVHPIREKIKKILKSRNLDPEQISRKIRILSVRERGTPPESFGELIHALIACKRIEIFYHGRERNRKTKREISPLRLIRYRDNWYLDAWCHERKSLRTFSVDRITKTTPLNRKAKEVEEETLTDHFTSAYGIFAGKADKIALLHFANESVRWVENEKWHPEQKARHVNDGYELEIPYSDSRELVRDILRWIPDVTVISPPELREEIKTRVEHAWKNFQEK